ncbi:eukaryotic translation initiation factor-like protein [Tanacetum coccineum]
MAKRYHQTSFPVPQAFTFDNFMSMSSDDDNTYGRLYTRINMSSAPVTTHCLRAMNFADLTANKLSKHPISDTSSHQDEVIDSLDSLHINASTATKCIPFTTSIMNKLTSEKFGLLKGQVIDSRITTIDILKGIISFIFDKAILKPTFCPMYAQLCSDLNTNFPITTGSELTVVGAYVNVPKELNNPQAL